MRRERRHEDLERLFHEHASQMVGFLVYRLGDRALAEDVVADTFERVMTAKRGWQRGGASEKTWLYTIALNRARDLVRRQAAEQRAVAKAGAPEGEADDPALQRLEDRDLLERALAELSDDEREAVALRYGGGLTLQEIAEALGEKQTTVEGRVYRGLRRLREQLDESAVKFSGARS